MDSIFSIYYYTSIVIPLIITDSFASLIQMRKLPKSLIVINGKKDFIVQIIEMRGI